MSLEDVLVSQIMIKDVHVVGEMAPLREACKVMSSHDIGSVVIVTDPDKSNDRIPVGIITERDVVKQIGIDPYRSHLSVSELTTERLISVPPSTSIRYALRLMVSENVRHLPVVENSKLVGILADRDIYRAIVKSESLIASLINDELLMKGIGGRDQSWVYKLGEVLHKRIGMDGKE